MTAHSMRSISITGTGMFVPPHCVSASDIDQRLGRPSGFSLKISGPRTRYVVQGETSSDMAAAAAHAALEAAKLRAEDLDLIISASAVAEQPIPSQAVLISRRLGLEGKRIPAYDVNATCLSFLVALDTLSDSIASGRYKNVLIVSSEAASRGLNWDDPVNSVLFGDGAAAAVIRHDPSGACGIIASLIETYPEGAESCQLRSGGTKLRSQDGLDRFLSGETYEMDGATAYKLTIKYFPEFLDRLLLRAGLGIKDIDLVIPHQASAFALDHLTTRLGIPAGKIVNIFEDYGNQIAVSIPTALHLARTTGRLKEGMTVLLAGTAAGLTFGGIIMRV